MRKLLALILALTLLAGQLLLPAGAETTKTEVIPDGTKTTTTSTEGNTQTVTVEISTADPKTGDSSSSTTTTTTTTTSSSSPGGTSTTTTASTTTTDTTTTTTTPGAGGDSTTVQTDTHTESESSEKTVQTVTNDYSTNIQTVSGSNSGSESSETTTTITTTDQDADAQIGSATIVEADKTENLGGSVNDPDPDEYLDDEENWTNGENTEVKQDWTGSGIQTGEEPDLSTGTVLEQETTVITPEEPGATLNMTPDGKWVTEKIEITLADVSDGKYDLDSYDPKEYDIETKTDKDGNTIGWTVTKRTETSTETKKTEVDTGSWTQVGGYTESVGTDQDLETKADNTQGRKLDENTTEYVTRLYDDDNNFIGYQITTVTVQDDYKNDTQESTRDTETSSGDLKTAEGYLLPTKPDSGSSGNEDGGTTTVTVEDLMEGGVLVGYTVVTKITDANGELVSTEERELRGTNVSAATQENTGFVLPEKPAQSKTTNPYGDVTKVTVTDLMEGGVHVGYTIVTKVTSAAGDTIRTETRNIYGTTSSTQVEVVKDPLYEEITTHTKTTTTKVENIYFTDYTRTMEQTQSYTQFYDTTILTEQDTYELVSTDGGMYFLYQGKMYAVTGTSTTNFSATLTPDMDLVNNPGADTDLYRKNTAANGRYDGYSENQITDSMYEDGYEYLIVGNGAASELGIRRYKKEGGSTTVGTITNHQFALRDRDGNLFYVYCADMATSVQVGANYNMENVEDADYYQGADAVSHIQTVAINGFWATESGTGSLAAVQALLKKYGYDDAAKYITEGEALSATQAAIWTFGNNDDDRWVDGSNPVAGSTYADTLYKLLISDKLMEDTSAKNATTTDILNKNDVMGSSITVHGVATNSDGTVKTVEGGTVYNTDVSFSLSVTKSDLTGNLTVTLTQGGRTVDTINLATADSNILGKILSGGKEVGTSITFKGVELVEGVEFNISLDGTQELKEGVYLYTAKGGYTAAQTFVGVASGSNTVDVDMKMIFTVEDPQIKYTHTETETHREDSQEFTRINSREDTARLTSGDTGSTKLTQTTHYVDIYGDVTVTETETEKTKEDRKWETYWKYLMSLINDEDGKGGDGDVTILDEDVALADAPKTGDISGLWAAVSLLSLGGAAILSVKRKEEE